MDAAAAAGAAALVTSEYEKLGVASEVVNERRAMPDETVLR